MWPINITSPIHLPYDGTRVLSAIWRVLHDGVRLPNMLLSAINTLLQIEFTMATLSNNPSAFALLPFLHFSLTSCMNSGVIGEGCLEQLSHRRRKKLCGIGWWIYMKPNGISLQHDQTITATTTGALLPQENTLSTYKNVKQEKCCLGKKNKSEINWEMNELNVWCKRKLQDTWPLEMRTNCPQWHQPGAAGCKGGTDFTIAQSDGEGCVDEATFICTGTLMTGLFGPILC